MIRLTIAAIVPIAASACSGQAQVAEREKHWVEATGFFFAQSRQMSDLHGWLRERNVYYTFDNTDIVDGKWSVGLEKIPVDTFVCESWTVRLSVRVTPTGQITEHAVDKQGVCL